MSCSLDASTSGAGGLISTADNTGSLQLKTAGTTAVTIDTSQNVGIGTTSPTLKFQVNGQVGINTGTTPGANGSGIAIYASDFPRLSFRNSTTGDANTDGLQIYMVDNDVSYNLLETGYQRWFTGNAERMRIDSSGRVCINNTTSAGGQPLYVKALAGVGSAGLQVSANGSGAIDWYNASATYVASVIVNASSVAYNTTSDYRLKDDIVPMTGALDKISQLKPVNWKWKLDGSDGQGFIAHELQAVIPDAVSGEKDAVDADGNPEYQGVDTSFLVATLTAAIQEMKAIIDEQSARITALENK